MKSIKNICYLFLAFTSFNILLISCKSGSETNQKADGSVELKLNFKTGDKFLYSTQIDQNISYNQAMNMNQSMLMEMVYAYAGEEGGNKQLDITYDHMLFKMTSPMGGESVYDSKNPGKRENDMGIMDSLIGKSFKLSVAPNGDIVKVDGLNKIVEALGGGNDKSAAKEISNQFNDTSVKLLMQNSFDLYPGHAVKIGDTWGKKSQMAFSGLKVNMENNYTLKSISGTTATVALVSNISMPKMEMGAADGTMSVEMKGKQEGTMDVDIETGRIISGKTSQNISGTMNAAGQQMPMSIKGDITITSKKI